MNGGHDPFWPKFSLNPFIFLKNGAKPFNRERGAQICKENFIVGMVFHQYASKVSLAIFFFFFDVLPTLMSVGMGGNEG